MTRSCFITATDTGAGKTFVAAAIARALRTKGVAVGVMKPVESGCAERDGALVPGDALILKEASGSADPIEAICPYRFAPALSPHLAARISGSGIDFAALKNVYLELSARHDLMLVEGAGGLLAPLTEGETVADLVALLRLPLIIVAPSKLGVINHALLTVEAAQKRGLEVGAVVLNGVSAAADPSTEYNSKEIKRMTGLPVFEIPHAKKNTPGLAAGGILDRLFR